MSDQTIERRVIEPGGVAQLVPAWRALTERSARSPFESPAWLLPWLRHYGPAWQPLVITWWRSGELAAVAPVAWRGRRYGGIPYRELAFWGWTETPLRGWVDIVAEADVAVEVGADFAAWLEAPDQEWDLFSYLHLDPASPTLAVLTAPHRPWWRVDLSHVLHSLQYVVPLPEEASTWHGHLGGKARHEIRREIRLFEGRLDGRIEEVHEAAGSDEIVDALGSLMADRWREREAYFRRDPRFRQFALDATREALKTGAGWALVARDPERTAACLLVLAVGRTAAAVLIGVSQERHYRAMSLGKCLFELAIEGAVARGCREFSFLTEGGYKTAFWHAEGRPTESGFLGRGPIGRAIAASATVRRVPHRLRNALAERHREYRP